MYVFLYLDLCTHGILIVGHAAVGLFALYELQMRMKRRCRHINWDVQHFEDELNGWRAIRAAPLSSIQPRSNIIPINETRHDKGTEELVAPASDSINQMPDASVSWREGTDSPKTTHCSILQISFQFNGIGQHPQQPCFSSESLLDSQRYNTIVPKP